MEGKRVWLDKAKSLGLIQDTFAQTPEELMDKAIAWVKDTSRNHNNRLM